MKAPLDERALDAAIAFIGSALIFNLEGDGGAVDVVGRYLDSGTTIEEKVEFALAVQRHMGSGIASLIRGFAVHAGIKDRVLDIWQAVASDMRASAARRDGAAPEGGAAP